MKTRIELVWDEIATGERQRLTDEAAFVLRRIDPASPANIFAGVDGAGRVMLAVGVARPPPALTLESDSIDYFRQQRIDGSWLMALRLCEMDLVVVFGRLCQDLIESLVRAKNEEELVALVQERLHLWRRLFEQGMGGQLEPSRVKGLLAELVVLQSLVTDGGRTALEIVTAWVGPRRADQDFQFHDAAIEVKAVGLGAETVSISSLEQLDSVVPMELVVLSLRVSSPGEAGAIGLNGIVRWIEGALAPASDALDLFRSRLKEAGYVEDPHYDSISFQLVSTEKFAVTPLFPRLTLRQVPAGLVAATYSLSLSALRTLGESSHG